MFSPLLILILAVVMSIALGGLLVWMLTVPSLDPTRLKRTNKGRRSSDQ